MEKTKISNHAKIIILLIYIFIGIALALAANAPQCYNLSTECLVIIISFFFTGGAWIYYIFQNGFYIFEPSTIVLGLTLVSYTIAPIISIYNNDLTINGFPVFNGCIKASILYDISFSLFLYFYYHHFQTYRKNSYDKKRDYTSFPPRIKRIIILMCFLFCFISISICLINLIKKGFSINYILSLGSQGNLEQTEEDIGAIINLRYLMVSSFLYLDLLCTSKKDKFLILTLRIIAIACLFATNKRWLIIILILSPIVLKFVFARKSPHTKNIIIVGLLLFFINGAMQYMRYYSTTSITNVDWSYLNFKELWKGVSGNFDLYKTLYAAVEFFPNKHSHTLGQQMIYLTLVTCIPRSIWPEKPISILEELKLYFMGQGSIDGAWAYAQFTEYYVEFGFIGLFILFSMFGLYCRWLKQKTNNFKSYNDLVLVAFMYPMLMQLVIRGYMPINFWSIFFMMIPVFFIKKITKKYEKE